MGGTILRGRGAAIHKENLLSFFDLEIEPEKDFEEDEQDEVYLMAERVRKTVNSQKGFMGFLRKLFGRKSIIDERRTLPKPIDDYSVTYNHMKVEEMKKEREVPQKVKIKEEKER